MTSFRCRRKFEWQQGRYGILQCLSTQFCQVFGNACQCHDEGSPVRAQQCVAIEASQG